MNICFGGLRRRPPDYSQRAGVSRDDPVGHNRVPVSLSSDRESQAGIQSARIDVANFNRDQANSVVNTRTTRDHMNDWSYRMEDMLLHLNT